MDCRWSVNRHHTQIAPCLFEPPEWGHDSGRLSKPIARMHRRCSKVSDGRPRFDWTAWRREKRRLRCEKFPLGSALRRRRVIRKHSGSSEIVPGTYSLRPLLGPDSRLVTLHAWGSCVMSPLSNGVVFSRRVPQESLPPERSPPRGITQSVLIFRTPAAVVSVALALDNQRRRMLRLIQSTVLESASRFRFEILKIGLGLRE